MTMPVDDERPTLNAAEDDPSVREDPAMSPPPESEEPDRVVPNND